jgi:phage-related protein
MARGASIVIDLIVNASKAQGDLNKASAGFSRFSSGLRRAAVPAAAVVTAIAGIGAATIKSASDMQQALGGVDAVFGKNAAVVKQWAADAGTSVGLSTAEYSTFAAQIGAQLKNLGVPLDQVAGKTDELIKLGADLAATYGGTTGEAVAALGAAMRGEADPAERYGLALNKTAVNARMAADGTDKLTGAAKTQAQAQALLAMATEQAGGAIGQFGRESDSAAGSAQIAAAQFENAKAALGTSLLPIVAQVATQFARLAAIVTKYPAVFKALIAVTGALAVAILVLNAAMWVLSANPIVLIVAAIVAAFVGLVVVIAILWKKFDTASKYVAVWNALKAAVARIAAGFQAAIAWVQRLWVAVQLTNALILGAFRAAWSAIVGVVVAIVGAIVGFVRRMVAAIVRFLVQISPPFILAFRLMQAVARLVFAVVSALVRVFVGLVRIAAQVIALVFRTAWNAVKAVVTAVINYLTGKIRAFLGPVRAVVNSIRAAFSAAWSSIRSTGSAMAAAVIAVIRRILGPARSVIASIKSAFSSGWSAVRAAAGTAASAIVSAIRRVLGPVASVASQIRSRFLSALHALRSAAGSLGSALTAPFRMIAGAVNSAIGAIQRLIGWLSRIKVPSIKIPSGASVSGSAAMAPSGVPGVAGLRTAAPLTVRSLGGRTGRATGTSGTTVIVQGALDPDAVARQIERILSGASRRRSGVVLGQRAAGAAA